MKLERNANAPNGDDLKPNQFDHDDYKPDDVRRFIHGIIWTAVAGLIAICLFVIGLSLWGTGA